MVSSRVWRPGRPSVTSFWRCSTSVEVSSTSCLATKWVFLGCSTLSVLPIPAFWPLAIVLNLEVLVHVILGFTSDGLSEMVMISGFGVELMDSGLLQHKPLTVFAGTRLVASLETTMVVLWEAEPSLSQMCDGLDDAIVVLGNVYEVLCGRNRLQGWTNAKWGWFSWPATVWSLTFIRKTR